MPLRASIGALIFRKPGVKSRIGQSLRRVLDSEPRTHVTFPIARSFDPGYLDCLQADSSGLLRIEGWSREIVPVERYPQLIYNGVPLPLLQHFRFSRADVPAESQSAPSQTGVAWEFVLGQTDAPSAIELKLPTEEVLPVEIPFAVSPPHYNALFGTEQVLHRGDIYGSGPPNRTVHPEVLQLAKRLPGPVLDFGCGRGTLIGELHAEGTLADGLEMDSPVLREAITPALGKHITLYDGRLPSPFEDASYQSVVCSEVLEHIADYQAAVADIARIAREQVLITVPDASAIPTGHRHGLVPWHLLEGSHLNFFCQSSLENTLRPHFKRVEFGRVGISSINDTSFYVSLTANCLK